jgi:hypothetical protein
MFSFTKENSPDNYRFLTVLIQKSRACAAPPISELTPGRTAAEMMVGESSFQAETVVLNQEAKTGSAAFSKLACLENINSTLKGTRSFRT